MNSQTEKTVNSFLLDEILTHLCLKSCLLNTHFLVTICPAYRIKRKNHIGLFIHQDTKKQGKNNCYEKEKAFTLPVGWEDSELFPEGLIFKLLLAGETFNSLQMDGMVYQIGVGHKKINVCVYVNMNKKRKENGVTTKMVTNCNKT